MQPIFKTDRLLVRPRTLADTEACLAMDREPEVLRFIQGPWSDAAAHRAFIEARTLGPYAEGLGYWTVWRGEEAASFVGWILLIPLDGIGPEIEIGWRLRREAWRQGFATEAARPVLRHAFATLKLPEVIADIDPDNTGSRRVAEKLGFALRGPVLHQGKSALQYVARMERA